MALSSSRELQIKFTGDVDPSVDQAANETEKVMRGMADDVEGSGKRSTAALGILQGAAGGIAAKLVDVAAAGAQAVKEFLGSSVTMASDLNETLSKSEAIFGEQAGAMESWAASSDRSFGLSKAAALDAAAGFGDMFLQLGFAGDQAAGMSQDIVGLAADLGSFNNMETTEVLDMLSASFRGEYDSLQRVIPNINATRVETEALAQTGKSSAKELTAQEKATATLSIVQGDAARAAGDFAKTSDGAANMQKILGAQVDNLKSKLGQGLLPILTGVLGFVTDTVMPGLDQLGDRFAPVFDGLSTGIGVAKTALADGWTFGGDSPELEPSTNPVVNLMREVGGVVADTQQGVTEFGNGLNNTFGDISPNASLFQQTMFSLGTGVRENVLPAWGELKDAVGGFFERLTPIVTEVTGFVKAKFAEWAPTISQYTGQVTEIVGSAMTMISTVIQLVGGWITTFWNQWGGTIMAVAGTAWNTVGSLIGNALGMIQGTISVVTSIMRGDWSGAMDGMRQVTDNMTSAVWNALTGLVNMIGNLFGVDNLTGKITAGFSSAISWINSKFIGGVNGVLSKVGIDWAIPQIPGYAGGGYTGAGGVHEPAGVVHRGEVVWSQRDVAAWGGPQQVDAMRRWRGYEDGGIVGDMVGAASNVLELVRNPAGVLTDLVDKILGDAPGGLAGAFIRSLRALPELIGEKIRGKLGALLAAGDAGGSADGVKGGWPVSGPITSPYGWRNGPFFGAELHDGVDIGAPGGTPVRATIPGVTTVAGWNGGYGNYVRLDHGGFSTFYGHLSAILTTVGKVLAVGDVLGLVGTTGASTGNHLHWGYSGGDPMSLLYDGGGMLQPGTSLVRNATGRPEPVLTAEQWDGLADRLNRLIAVLEALIGRPVLDENELAVVLAGIDGRRGEPLR